MPFSINRSPTSDSVEVVITSPPLPGGTLTTTVHFSGLEIIAYDLHEEDLRNFAAEMDAYATEATVIPEPFSDYQSRVMRYITNSRTTFCRDALVRRGTLPTMPPVPSTTPATVTIEPASPVDDIPAPGTFLGYAVVRHRNVAPGTVSMGWGERIAYVNPTDRNSVWMSRVRREVGRYIQRNPVTLTKVNCQLCGRPFPWRQGIDRDRFCSDGCREKAADFLMCSPCGGMGRDAEGHECGSCFGSGFAQCVACSEDNARISLGFFTSGGGIYHVCPTCYPIEVEAGAERA